MESTKIKFIWFKVDDFSDWGDEPECLYCHGLFELNGKRQAGAFWFEQFDPDGCKYSEDQLKAGFEIAVHETINQLWYERML